MIIFYRNMAPSKRADHAIDAELKEEIFSGVQFNGKVPESFVSLTDVVRGYGISMQVIIY
jgi:hypothetical protein